jgi:hypothetical protein
MAKLTYYSPMRDPMGRTTYVRDEQASYARYGPIQPMREPKRALRFSRLLPLRLER